MMIVFAPNHFGNGRSHRIHSYEFIRSMTHHGTYSSPRARALALGYH